MLDGYGKVRDKEEDDLGCWSGLWGCFYGPSPAGDDQRAVPMGYTWIRVLDDSSNHGCVGLTEIERSRLQRPRVFLPYEPRLLRKVRENTYPMKLSWSWPFAMCKVCFAMSIGHETIETRKAHDEFVFLRCHRPQSTLIPNRVPMYHPNAINDRCRADPQYEERIS